MMGKADKTLQLNFIRDIRVGAVKSPSKIIQAVKSITAKEIFKLHPEVKEQLWGGEFWTKGYYVNTPIM